MKLTMRDYVQAVKDHRFDAFFVLSDAGYPGKLINAKAEKAASKGYTNYGTSCSFSWIEPEGEAFLEATRD